MADELGMSLGKAKYLLRALLGKGFVMVQAFRNSSNKRGYAYALTPEAVAAKGRTHAVFFETEYRRVRYPPARDRAVGGGERWCSRGKVGRNSLDSSQYFPRSSPSVTDRTLGYP